ncbi:cobaltochelatase subunit CobN [Seleniivibrio sp.]|uniref:cobaltochelatase subunit CobN n=1 Tax=Seleniivibrio sp. TaxID=2898801 RepID=UPI0025CF64C9|nr:cobaltochelatase subunit CobN [Seleniivibrio sp.]MCD8554731.1 cobaltochelatase subunit CobN [Seleniivibrio sp.]
MMRITGIVWSSHAQALIKGAAELDFVRLNMFGSKDIARDESLLKQAFEDAENSDVVLLYRSADVFWQEVEDHFKGSEKTVICLSHDPSYWALSNVSVPILRKCAEYLRAGGSRNAAGLLSLIANEVMGIGCPVPPVFEFPWQGVHHPSAPSDHYENIDDYLDWYDTYCIEKGLSDAPCAGILFSRHYWVNGQLDVEHEMIRALEDNGMRVIPAFSNGTRDSDVGALGSGGTVEKYFMRGDEVIIDVFVKMLTFFLDHSRGNSMADTKVSMGGTELLKRLNVPVFQPVVSSSKTIEEWEDDPIGLSADIPWSIAMPEFEGVIEPFFIGGMKKGEYGSVSERTPHKRRCGDLAIRIGERVRLGKSPAASKRVVFMLHNAACASVEATVGSGAGLDTTESVVRLMHLMKRNGFDVRDIPESGEALSQMILTKKAISEFRWTTVDEIVNKGGALAQVDVDTYCSWWDELPEKIKNRMCEVWGNPPGEAVGGMPPAMVHDGKIVVTGLDFGNVLVCVQPKRGCAGARCDGEVCKILHDPDIPPPHQYLATYRWIEKEYGAHAVIHVGTHGTLEFLPGKGAGLSEACLPDIVIGKLPHLYIYNADNSPEGIIAKRRSYATLVNHMQAPLIHGGLYGDYLELDRMLGEWEQAKVSDAGRCHMLEHIIIGLLEQMKMQEELGFFDLNAARFSEVKDSAHGVLSRMRNTRIQDGMHIFGHLPEDEAGYVYGVLHFDTAADTSPRRLAAKLLSMDFDFMLNNQGTTDEDSGFDGGTMLEMTDAAAQKLVRLCMTAGADELINRITEEFGDCSEPEKYLALRERALDILERLRLSTEDLSMLNAVDGGYTPAGASGLIYRGKDDVLPTGRNMFSLDPESVPTKAAAVLGRKLSDALINKYLNEEGRLPENVAFYWMCADIMWSDGEGMAQMMHLLGVRPVWAANGRVQSFEIMPLSELGRPRIDLTIRVSGITRDNFPDRIALIDRAIQAVAELEEPIELNFVRKHSLENIKEQGTDPADRNAFRRASRRIFSAAPGTYRAGVNLAVYASAWKTESDLADIFIAWNGYAYGDGYFGEASYEELARSLATVDVTFNKIMDDAHDLLGCCGYFGNHGGLSVTAGHLKGEKIKNYYGDTREPSAVEVRTLSDEIRRVVRTKLLNPKWIDGMKRHGYKGAGDISKRIGRVFGWEAATGDVDDKIFDDITRTFLADKENREFFEKHNPWALEEAARRLIEAEARGLWNADPEMLDTLKDTYLEIEGWIEERMGDIEGDFQGGSIDIIGADEVAGWKESIDKIKDAVQKVKKK